MTRAARCLEVLFPRDPRLRVTVRTQSTENEPYIPAGSVLTIGPAGTDTLRPGAFVVVRWGEWFRVLQMVRREDSTLYCKIAASSATPRPLGMNRLLGVVERVDPDAPSLLQRWLRLLLGLGEVNPLRALGLFPSGSPWPPPR